MTTSWTVVLFFVIYSFNLFSEFRLFTLMMVIKMKANKVKSWHKVAVKILSENNERRIKKRINFSCFVANQIFSNHFVFLWLKPIFTSKSLLIKTTWFMKFIWQTLKVFTDFNVSHFNHHIISFNKMKCLKWPG